MQHTPSSAQKFITVHLYIYIYFFFLRKEVTRKLSLEKALIPHLTTSALYNLYLSLHLQLTLMTALGSDAF